MLLWSKSFANRVVAAWNQLPEEVAAAPTVNGFKNGLYLLWAAE